MRLLLYYLFWYQHSFWFNNKTLRSKYPKWDIVNKVSSTLTFFIGNIFCQTFAFLGVVTLFNIPLKGLDPIVPVVVIALINILIFFTNLNYFFDEHRYLNNRKRTKYVVYIYVIVAFGLFFLGFIKEEGL